MNELSNLIDSKNDGIDILFDAVDAGCKREVWHLVEAGVNVNGRGSDPCCNILQHCAKKGKHKCLKILLKAGASAVYTDINGFSALMHACYHNQVECALKLIPYSDINLKNNYNISLLEYSYMNASKLEHLETLKELLRRGVRVKGLIGDTVVSIAEKEVRKSARKLLKAAGARFIFHVPETKMLTLKQCAINTIRKRMIDRCDTNLFVFSKEFCASLHFPDYFVPWFTKNIDL